MGEAAVDGNEEGVGFFSRLRWGPGSITIVAALTAAAAALLAEAAIHDDYALYFAGGVLALVDVIIVAVKGLEEITPSWRRPDEGLVGRRGKVVIDVYPERPGVVRVGNELWSAASDRPIRAGTEVIVVGRSGLYLEVREAGPEHQ